MRKKIILGIAGNIAAGKSYACRMFLKIAQRRGLEFCHLEVDHIRRYVLTKSKEKAHLAVRRSIAQKLDLPMRSDNCFIEGEILGEAVFSAEHKMLLYNNLMLPVLKDLIAQAVRKSDGIIALEWPMLMEDGFLPLINSKILLLTCDQRTQRARLLMPDISMEQLKKRIVRQSINNEIKGQAGEVLVFDTSHNPGEAEYKSIFAQLIT